MNQSVMNYCQLKRNCKSVPIDLVSKGISSGGNSGVHYGIENKEKLKVVYTNSRSLGNKIVEFEQSVALERQIWWQSPRLGLSRIMN